MDFTEDLVRIKLDEIPETMMEKAKQSIKDCAVSAIYLAR